VFYKGASSSVYAFWSLVASFGTVELFKMAMGPAALPDHPAFFFDSVELKKEQDIFRIYMYSLFIFCTHTFDSSYLISFLTGCRKLFWKCSRTVACACQILQCWRCLLTLFESSIMEGVLSLCLSSPDFDVCGQHVLQHHGQSF